MTKKINVSEVMQNAWKEYCIYGAPAYGGDGTKDFSQCLREAWDRAKNDNTPAGIIARWEAFKADTEEDMRKNSLYLLLLRNIKKASKNHIGLSIEDKYARYHEGIVWTRANDDELVSELLIALDSPVKARKKDAITGKSVWYDLPYNHMSVEQIEKKNAARAKRGLPNITFISMIYNKALTVINNWYKKEKKHFRVPSVQYQHEIVSLSAPAYTGKESTKTIEDTLTSKHISVETEALQNIQIELIYAACGDETDKMIINGLKEEKTARQIALQLNMSHTAVNKRIAKIARHAIATRAL